ncbi:hypothetical protein FTUN_5778 [Frigoriglobus tundricola]|uniref:Thioester reductase (TE) domain-containing protein n=1 Tax=Frigoriglobus tundricola TaxID=2774151 RepID=A0A6M5YVT1_9BACT|nr:hypothetical protein FTUN_5778 [Frigoriglobus tundricola]
MTADTTLLTGATGLLGRYLLRDLSARGVPLAVLVRGDRQRPAAARLDTLLGCWDREFGRRLPRPHLLEGDLTKPGLGLSREAAAWMAARCRQVVHNGASLTFVGADRTGDPWLTNVTGTANVVAACRAAGVRALHYVSTAYVCGRRTDCVYENEPVAADGFRNDYEASKAAAERLVRAADFPEPVTVLRPAVIVGDYATGFTSTYHGLYLYLQFLWQMARRAPRRPDRSWRLPIRLNLAGGELRNIVPVDWVSAVMADVVSRPELHGRTYHLAPARPLTTQSLEASIAGYFGYEGVTFAGRGALAAGSLTPAEAQFYKYVARYEQYWADEPRFDTRNLQAAVPDRPCPPTDAAFVRRLIDYAIGDDWGRKRAPRPAPVSA